MSENNSDNFIENKIIKLLNEMEEEIPKITDDTYESIVYISHPYSGKKENEEKVANIINNLSIQYPNYLFISPIHAFSYAYHTLDYQKGINQCLWLLEKCDEVWVYGDWQNSKGCKMEVDYAMEYSIPVVYRNNDVI